MIYSQATTPSRLKGCHIDTALLLAAHQTTMKTCREEIPRTYLGRNAHELLGVHVTLALLGLLDIGEGGRNDDGLAIVGEALEVLKNKQRRREWRHNCR